MRNFQPIQKEMLCLYGKLEITSYQRQLIKQKIRAKTKSRQSTIARTKVALVVKYLSQYSK